MKELSIIMPLYNAEKYLEEALKCIKNQRYKKFELICINDASTDKTTEILRDYQKDDTRLKILSNTEHRGAAFSRNRGIKAASGKYLIFLDGDDIFDEDLLEAVYRTAEEKSTDIVIYEYQHVPTELIYNKLEANHGKEYINRYCKQVFCIRDYKPHEFIIWSLGLCNKLYRRKFVEEQKLYFQDLSSSNDVYFVCMALLLAERIIALDDNRVMLYARDHGVPTRISFNRDSNCVYAAFIKIGEELVKRKLFDRLSEYYYYKIYFYLKNALIADTKRDRAKQMYHFLCTEGIHNICALDSQSYMKADSCIHNYFNQFKKQSYESGWYKEDNAFEIYLYNMSDDVINLIHEFNQGNKKIAVWGAGKNGKIFINFCQQNELKIDVLVDKAKEKQGLTYRGYVIQSPNNIFDNIQIIIVSAFSIYDDVLAEIGNRNIKVIDINRFLCLI